MIVSVWDAGPAVEPIPIKSVPRLTPITGEAGNSPLLHRAATRVWPAMSVLLTLGPLGSFLCHGGPSGDFEGLIADRTAIERIYYTHRLGNKPPFEQLLPRTAIETLVRADLKKETVLKQVYGIDPTTQTIQAEVSRIQAETRAPEILAEIKKALGSDPARFARAVARQIVVERELRRRYENDDHLHATQRRQAEAIREKVLAARGPGGSWEQLVQTLKETPAGAVEEIAWQLGPRREQSPVINTAAPVATPTPVKVGSARYSIDATAQFAVPITPAQPQDAQDKVLYFDDLSGELRDALRAQLQKAGDVSAVIETPGAFLVFVARAKTPDRLSAAVLSIPKRSFEQWLAEQKE